MAWLTGWNRRRSIIVNGTSTDQTDYQMKLSVGQTSGGNVSCNGNIISDFSDIRFTSSDGSTKLYYWIESISGSSPNQIANVWIKIGSIPISGTSIYIYYNNPSPPSDNYGSNGDGTFIFMDDFSYGSVSNGYTYTNKWDLQGLGACASITESGGTLTLSCPGGCSSNTDDGSIANRITIGNGIDLRFKVVSASANSNWNRYSVEFGTGGRFYPYGACGNSSLSNLQPNDGYALLIQPPSYSDIVLYRIDSGTTTQLVATPNGAIDPNGKYFKLTWLAPNIYVYTSTDNSTWTTQLSSASAPSKTAGKLFLAEFTCGDRGGSIVYDYLFVKKFTSPEPTWGAVSTEQNVVLNITSTPTGAEIWLRSPSGSGAYIDQSLQTNTSIGVVPGSYDIKLTHGSYQDWYLLNQSFTASQTYNIPATLTILPGSLAISSTPSGAEIWLAGNDMGVTTVPGGTTIPNLNPGSYNILLRLTGYQDWTGSATVNTNSTTTVSATFAGSASITSTPTNAAVYLDGSPTSIGNTTIIITNLTSPTSGANQSHNYILKLTGYADTSGSFTATAGSTINVPITFPGSLYITSIPTGASIYIDGVLQ